MAFNPKPTLSSAQLDFRGGLSRKLNAYMIGDNQVVSAEDAIVHRGGIRKNSGHSAQLSSVPVGSRGLSLFRTTDLGLGAVNSLMMQYANGRTYRLSGARAGNVISSGFGTATKISYAEVNRKVYYSGFGGGSANFMHVWSGSTQIATRKTGTAGPPQNSRFFFLHPDSNRLFAGRGATNTSRVYFSEIDNPDSWPTNNFFDIGQSDYSDYVTGFGLLFGKLVIFGRKSINILYGTTTSDFVLKTLDRTSGAFFPFTIVQYDGFIVFLALDGIYVFDGSGPAQKISDPVENIIDDVYKNVENGPVAMRSREGHYVLSYVSATGTNAVAPFMGLDRELVCIPPSANVPMWTFTGPNKRGFSYYSRWNDGLDETYAMDATSGGQLFRLERTQLYNGAGIDLLVETKQWDCGTPFTRKQFLEVELQVEAGGNYQVEILYKIDNEASWRRLTNVGIDRVGPVYGDVDATEGQRNRVIYRAKFQDADTVGNYIQLRLRQLGVASVAQPTNILGYRITARPWKELEQ